VFGTSQSPSGAGSQRYGDRDNSSERQPAAKGLNAGKNGFPLGREGAFAVFAHSVPGNFGLGSESDELLFFCCCLSSKVQSLFEFRSTVRASCGMFEILRVSASGRMWAATSRHF